MSNYSKNFKSSTLLVITNRYPYKEAHFSIFVKSQVDHIAPYFKKVIVASITPWFPKFLYNDISKINYRWAIDIKAKNYAYDNIEVYYLKIPTIKSEYYKMTVYLWAQMIKLRQLLKKLDDKPVLIHSHYLWPSGCLGKEIKYIEKIPLVVTVHGYDVYSIPFRTNLNYKKIINTIKSADKIISVGNTLKLNLIKKLSTPENKVIVIPNGYDDDLFSSIPRDFAREKLNLPKNKKIVLTVGNLVPEKAYHHLIMAMKKVVKKKDNCILIMVGDGILRNQLEDLAKKERLEDKIVFVGRRPHSEIPLWMNASDLFVLSSEYEGNPTVMFEALGTGLPFVGPRVGGIPEIIISEEIGFLCPPKDPECLAQKIIDALNKKWDKEKIIEYAKQYSWSNIARQIIKVYDDVLKSYSNQN